MNKKMLSIILGAVLVAAFFLDWGGKISGFDWVKLSGGPWEKYVLLLLPISGAMLLVGALNNGNYPGGRGTWTWLPLVAVLFWLFGFPLIEGASIGDVFKSLGKGWGIGWWLTVVASLALAFYNPKD